MKLEDAQRNVETSGVLETNRFSVEMNAASIDILSSKIYSDAYLAIVRELACNAWDAHVAAGNTDTPFKIWFPADLKSEFKIRDYGTGLSHDDVMYLYTTYFGSNKRDTNSMIGGLGLGSKTPYAYTNAFSVRSFLDGTVRQYAAYKDSNGIPTISLVSEEDTDEHNGIEIAVPVKEGDTRKFVSVGQKALEWFPTPPQTVGLMVEAVDWETRIDACGMRKNGERYGSATVVMGNVAYSLNMNLLSKHTTFSRGISSMAKSARFVLFAEIGELTIAASREELNYTDHTINRLIDKLEVAHKTFIKHVTAGIENEKTLAGKFYWRSRLPESIRESVNVVNTVTIPTYIKARKVDAHTWRHETGLKTTTCGVLELRGTEHPAVLIAETKTLAFKKMVQENDEFHPKDKGHGGSRSYYSNHQASRDVYILWRPLEADDPDGTQRKSFDEFLLNFDIDHIFKSTDYAQTTVTPQKTKTTVYVKPSAKKRRLYLAYEIPNVRNRSRWSETEKSFEDFDGNEFVVMGFHAWTAHDHENNCSYPSSTIALANMLREGATFLGVPKAAWKTAKKQQFLTLEQFIEKRTKEFKAKLNQKDYVLSTNRRDLRAQSAPLVKFLEYQSIWNRHAPLSLVAHLTEKYKLLRADSGHADDMFSKISHIENLLNEKLFTLSTDDIEAYDKEIKGAGEWLSYMYPKMYAYIKRSSWTRLDELAGHYINCIEGIDT